MKQIFNKPVILQDVEAGDESNNMLVIDDSGKIKSKQQPTLNDVLNQGNQSGNNIELTSATYFSYIDNIQGQFNEENINFQDTSNNSVTNYRLDKISSGTYSPDIFNELLLNNRIEGGTATYGFDPNKPAGVYTLATIEDLTGSTGGSSYWSAGTGTDAIATVNGDNIASGIFAIATGFNAQAYGHYSNASGYNTQAFGNTSFAGGLNSRASGHSSHCSGENAITWNAYSFAHGYNVGAYGVGAVAFGYNTNAMTHFSFAFGENALAYGDAVIVLGSNITGETPNTTYVDRFNIKNVTSGTPITNLGIDAVGNVVSGTTGGGGTSYWSAGTGTNAVASISTGNIASGDNSIATGLGAKATGLTSNASGTYTIAGATNAHAEGGGSMAMGTSSHAEGNITLASGFASHSENNTTIASGFSSHAQGYQTVAGGGCAHAEGTNNYAMGDSSHAGGSNNTANGVNSFVHGNQSVVNGENSVVLGAFITGDTANTTFVDILSIKTNGAYANDAAADADDLLPSGGLYTLTGSRVVYRKP